MVACSIPPSCRCSVDPLEDSPGASRQSEDAAGLVLGEAEVLLAVGAYEVERAGLDPPIIPYRDGTILVPGHLEVLNPGSAAPTRMAIDAGPVGTGEPVQARRGRRLGLGWFRRW